jgi:hypothetical protein
MPDYTFEREARTSDSESFAIKTGRAELGRVDIHYGLDVVHATLCVPDNYSDDDVEDLIGEIDERLVLTAHPYREDFVVTVWIGRLAGVFSEDFDDDLDDDVEGNGHRE